MRVSSSVASHVSLATLSTSGFVSSGHHTEPAEDLGNALEDDEILEGEVAWRVNINSDNSNIQTEAPSTIN